MVKHIEIFYVAKATSLIGGFDTAFGLLNHRKVNGIHIDTDTLLYYTKSSIRN